MNYRSLLIVCLATLGLAVAGWGQADGKIAFISHRDGHDDVWLMNTDGSDPVNLTQGRYCASPVWSPDGTKIAYIDVGADYSGSAVWVMDADGGNPQQLTDDSELIDPINSDVLFWSEDGRSIYYPVWERSEMFAVALDGSGSSLMEGREAALILRRFQDHLNLSSDGTKGAYVFLRVGLPAQASLGVPAGQALLRIWSTGEDGYTDNIPLSDLPNFDPSWNPDISDVPPYPLTWAPNSMRIAFTSYTTNSTREIWAVDIDGSNLVNLTNGLGGHSPAWQPALPAATSVEAQSWGRIKSQLSTGIH